MSKRNSMLFSDVPVSHGNFGILSATAAVALSVSAVAAPPVLHDSKSIGIAAPVERVWEIAGQFADLTWVPAVKSSSATDGNNPGSHRTLDFGSAVLTETLVSYDGPAHTYTYRIDDTAANLKVVPVRGLVAKISVVAAGDGMSVATWEGSFSRVDQSSNPASGLDDATAQKQIAGTFTAGLAGLKAKAEAR
jgi:mxaD protein